MNESFDSDKFYTVADLLAYDLDGHSQLIHTIYLGAIAEYDLEINIAQVKKFWEERQFKLAKHIPDSIYNSKGIKQSPHYCGVYAIFIYRYKLYIIFYIYSSD